MSIRYNDYDLPVYSLTTKILEFLGGEEPTEDEVWELAKESENVPNFENVLQEEVFSRMLPLLEKKDITLEFFLNAHDTSFSLVTESKETHIYVYSDFEDVMELVDVEHN